MPDSPPGSNHRHTTNAIEKINSSVLDELVVTDSIPLSEEATNCKTIRQLSLSHMLAEAMRRISNEESLSAMFR